MPQLTLHIMNTKALPDGGALNYTVQGQDFQVGRGPGVHWVLPDPTKSISRQHLSVLWRNDAYWIHDISTYGTVLNGTRVTGIKQIVHNDQIVIGHYTIRVEFVAAPAVVASFAPAFGAASSFGQAGPVPAQLPSANPATAGHSPAVAGRAQEPDSYQTHWSPHAPPQTQHAPSPQGPSAQTVLAAIARGAGLPPDGLAGQDADKLGEEIGMCLRIMVEQMTALLAVRASTKKILKSQNRTMVEPRNNNPLKTSPNPDVALAQFFIQRANYFLPAAEALTEGFADIRQHQNASYAAMQTALANLIAELAPERTEEGVKGSFLNPKAAQSWAKYTRDWDARVQSHEHGMLGIFLSYFAVAYDEAVQTSKRPMS